MKFRQASAGLKVIMGILQGSRVFTGPLQVNFNITNRCNIRCIHCYFYSPHLEKPNMLELRKARLLNQPQPDLKYLKDQQKREANPERILTVIKDLAAMGTQRFQFGGNGEPFFHDYLMDFLEAAKNEKGYCVINTNGTLLSKQKIDRLIDLEVDNLRITTMAGTAHSFVSTHPGCSESVFEKMSENLLYLAEQKKNLKKSYPKITLVCVIIGPNSDSLLEFAKFAIKIKASSVVFHLFNDVEDPDFAVLIPTPDQAKTARKQLNESRILLDSLGIKHNINNALRVFHQKLDTRDLYRVIPCYLGWLVIRIDLDGNVYPCCRCYEALGNANDQNIMDIWNSEAYREWRKTAYKINQKKTSIENCACHTCVHHNLNTRIFKIFHPFKSRSSNLKKLYPASCEESN